jgi:hypothetical protein
MNHTIQILVIFSETAGSFWGYTEMSGWIKLLLLLHSPLSLYVISYWAFTTGLAFYLLSVKSERGKYVSSSFRKEHRFLLFKALNTIYRTCKNYLFFTKFFQTYKTVELITKQDGWAKLPFHFSLSFIFRFHKTLSDFTAINPFNLVIP